MPQRATIVVDLRAEPVRFVYPLFGPRHMRRVLPAGDGPPPRGAWVVTATGRRLDTELRSDPAFRLNATVRDVRVYAPAP